MEYQVSLKKVTVSKLNVTVDIKDQEPFQVEETHQASVFEPKESDEPTVLIHNQCTLKNTADETQFSISMEADFIFEFNPIPEQWIATASDYCPKLIKAKTAEIVNSILHSMGHAFAVSANR